MVGQEDWMDVRSLRKDGHTISAIHRLTGMSRNTIKAVLRLGGPAQISAEGRTDETHPLRGLRSRTLGGNGSQRSPDSRRDPGDGIHGFGPDLAPVSLSVSWRSQEGESALQLGVERERILTARRVAPTATFSAASGRGRSSARVSQRVRSCFARGSPPRGAGTQRRSAGAR